jgi:multidrug resistance efflux pump
LPGCSREKADTGGGRGNTNSAAEDPGSAGGAGGNSGTEERTVEAFGVVKPAEIMTITAGVEAVVSEVYVRRGDRAERGEPLIELDLSSWRRILSEKQSAVELAELRLGKLRQEEKRQDETRQREYTRISNQIAVAREAAVRKETLLAEKRTLLAEDADPDLEKLKHDLEVARTDHGHRIEDYEEALVRFERGAISERELNGVKSERDAAENTVAKLELDLGSSAMARRREIDSLELDLLETRSQLENLILEREKLATPGLTEITIKEREIEALRSDLRYLRGLVDKPWYDGSTVVSPFETGAVVELGVSEGVMVSSGDVLAVLADVADLEVEAYVPEEFIRDITLGGKAEITPVADPERHYPGRVTAKGSLAVDWNNETVVPVTVSLEENDGFLLPNFNVDLSFLVPEPPPDTAGTSAAEAGAEHPDDAE